MAALDTVISVTREASDAARANDKDSIVILLYHGDDGSPEDIVLSLADAESLAEVILARVEGR